MKVIFIFIDCCCYFLYFLFDIGIMLLDNVIYIKCLIFDVKRNSEFYFLLRVGWFKIKVKKCFFDIGW